jgi:glycosyltransferase domain-containing protein
MTSPLVSIGVPSYNRPKTLERTLQSLVNQTYRNIEIVISDDCSKDPCVETVINKFTTDRRVKFFRHSVNKGAIKNFNSILPSLTGEYFMRIADDDWIDKDYIEKCLGFLLKNSSYSAAYGSAKIYNTNGEFVKIDSIIDLVQDNGIDRVKHYFNNVLSNGCYYAVMHRSLIPHVVSQNYLAMDWLIVARIANIGKYKILEDTSSHIALGGDSHSMDHLTTAYNMSNFTKSFPRFAIGLNIGKDILWKSSAYNDLLFFKKMQLALSCFLIIFKRFQVFKEISPGIKKYIKLKIKTVVS